MEPTEFIITPKPSNASELLAAIAEFQMEADLTDFKVTVKEKVIHTHKVILAATCPYFATLFRESDAFEICMDGMDYDILTTIIQYLYGNTISVHWKTVRPMIETCDYLQLFDMKYHLSDIILKNITADNCIDFFQFAEKFTLPNVKKKAHGLMISNLDEATHTDEFMVLELPGLVDYIKHKDTRDPERDIVLLAAIESEDHDPVTCKEVITDVLKQVQLEECTASAVNNVMKKQEEVFDDPNVVSLIYEVILPRLKSMEENGKKKFLVLGGMDKYDGTPNKKCWALLTDRHWGEFTEFPEGSQAPQSPVVCLPDGFAVMCGGPMRRKNTKYSASTLTWTDLPDTPEQLKNARAVYCDESILVLDGGSCFSGGETDVGYILDLSIMQWKKLPSLLEKQYCPITCALDKTVYVVYNDEILEKTPCTLQTYTIDSSEWLFKSSLPEAAPRTYGASLSAEGEHLYLVGGNHKINARYTPELDSWTLLKGPLKNHWYGSACVSAGKIYVCGGGWCYDMNNIIEEYDIEKDEWLVSRIKMPTKLNFFTAAMVDFL